MSSLFDRCSEFFQGVQDRICAALAREDGKPFAEDLWEYPTGGGGRTRVVQEGNVFEKGGVNFSAVTGQFSEEFAQQLPGAGRTFSATGVSLVLHPWNPMVPTVHANFRFIEKGDRSWFGGGADLTPYYPYAEDCVHFHRVWRDVCRRHPAVADFDRFKNGCDEYFFLKHRNEARGIGGIFFDYLDQAPEATFTFVCDAADRFLDAYLPILKRRTNEPFGDREREFQLVRRGRYVEFNLIYDRGTTFGLKTGGRIESILMSLPLNVKWQYDRTEAPGSREAQLADFLKPQDWAGGGQ